MAKKRLTKTQAVQALILKAIKEHGPRWHAPYGRVADCEWCQILKHFDKEGK